MLSLVLTTLTVGTLELNPEAFTQIEQRGWVDVDVRIDPSVSAPRVDVSGSERSVALIEVQSSNGVLRIQNKPSSGSWSSNERDARVTVTVAKLETAKSAGSGDLRVTGLTGDAFRLRSAGSGDVVLEGTIGDLKADTSGSGDLEARTLAAETVRIRAPGSGDIELRGTANRLEVDLMGSGDIDGRELVVQDLDASIMGSGDITVCAKGKVAKHTMGSGDIRIRCRD